MFDFLFGWLFKAIFEFVWFVLSTLWEFAVTLWRRQRTNKSVRRFDAELRRQQRSKEAATNSPFAQPAPEKTPPQLPPSQSPFADARTLNQD